ncbi:MAG TPA: putative ABC exporter domain-containing protein, partial [Rhodanobacter sp.]|nr:putative ABC exporter domain-containing protein [Rhodanobacter sp.]
MNAAAAAIARGAGSPWSACVYQQAMSIRNAVVRRVLRLKQPKYLAGAVAGALYFYFFLFRHAFRGHGRDGGPGLERAVGWLHDPAIAPLVLGIAALALLVAMLATWLLPGERTALAFSEAEVAFLFPAPMTRSQLVRYKLLRSQLAILVSSVLLTVVLRRGGALGGSPWLHAIGWWVVLSTVRMHFIGASFARERLRGEGRLAWLRGTGAGALVLAAAIALFWWVRTHVPPPDADALLPWARQVLALPVLAWLLWPLKLVVAPVLAPDAMAFWRAAPAALAVMALHFFWIVRADASFEEAAIAQSRKRARMVEAKREGRLGFRAPGPARKRPAPFRLAPTGFPPVAMLWRNLIALGTNRLRIYAAIAAIVLAGEVWIAGDAQLRPLLKLFFGFGLGVGGWLLVVGPMFVQRSLHRVLAHMDLLKAAPLPGWQLALGELLMPILLLAVAEWLLLAMALLSVLLGGMPMVPTGAAVAAAIGAALLV